MLYLDREFYIASSFLLTEVKVAFEIWRKKKLKEVIGYSDSSIDRLEREGQFPKRLKLNPHGRAVGWRSNEVIDWLNGREQCTSSDTVKIGNGQPGPGRGKKKAEVV